MDVNYLLQQKFISQFLAKHAPTDHGRKKHRALARGFKSRLERVKSAKAGAAS